MLTYIYRPPVSQDVGAKNETGAVVATTYGTVLLRKTKIRRLERCQTNNNNNNQRRVPFLIELANMSLRRTATRRGGPPGTAPKQKKGYENVEQGIKQLYPEPDSPRKTDME